MAVWRTKTENSTFTTYEDPEEPQSPLQGHPELCPKCQAFPIQGPHNWKLKHYLTFAELQASARVGCKLCVAFHDGLLADYIGTFEGATVEDAERFWQSPPGKDRSNGEVSEGFWVIPCLVDLDQDFTSSSEPGLHALLFMWFDIEKSFDLYGRSWIAVPLSCSGGLPLLEWNIVRRPVRTRPDFALLGQWIDECITRHEICASRSSEPTWSPHRLLDLQCSDGGTELRLVENLRIPARYAALSHCWGGIQPRLKLTELEHPKFLEGIEFSQLPRLFQNAVTATRALGLRFLWIDTLCIIQDSQEDWQRECALMSKIYKYSTVTIAGPKATDSDDSFLNHGAAPQSQVLRIGMGDDCADLQIFKAEKETEIHTDFEPEPNSPLYKRGWILQERLLSPRVLYFEEQHTYMECMTLSRSDKCHHPIRSDGRAYAINGQKKWLLRGKDERHLLSQWLLLIQTYADLLITRRSDKLPAISGLAAEFSSQKLGRYLAGIWESHLLESLAWVNKRPLERSESLDQYIAPSWSWASANQVLYFQADGWGED